MRPQHLLVHPQLLWLVASLCYNSEVAVLCIVEMRRRPLGGCCGAAIAVSCGVAARVSWQAELLVVSHGCQAHTWWRRPTLRLQQSSQHSQEGESRLALGWDEQ